MSKNLFMLMREQEVATSNFLPTKKELAKSSKDFAEQLIDSGNHTTEELYAQALRLKEAVSVIEETLKSKLPQENFEAFGIKGTYRSGGDTINYSDDEVWLELKSKLSHRESLLKVALNSELDFYDEEGIKVPKVSTTPRKSSLAISF
jgi:hypothetical protein